MCSCRWSFLETSRADFCQITFTTYHVQFNLCFSGFDKIRTSFRWRFSSRKVIGLLFSFAAFYPETHWISRFIIKSFLSLSISWTLHHKWFLTLYHPLNLISTVTTPFSFQREVPILKVPNLSSLNFAQFYDLEMYSQYVYVFSNI